MSQPVAYVPATSFLTYQATQSWFPGQNIDIELAALKATTDQIRTNLALIQRDDGALANASVDLDQLTDTIKASFGDLASLTTVLGYVASCAADAVATAADAVSTAADRIAAASSASAAATSASSASTSATNAATTLANALTKADNLASLANAGTARTNLGLGSSATHASTDFLLAANNLSDVTAGTARTNLGLVIGTNVQAFDSVLHSNLPVNSKSAAYTTLVTDANGIVYHPTADNNARTFTIDSNANVAYAVGTTLTFVNDINTVTIAITSDTLVLAGAGSTGSRTLAANGIATAVKVASTRWYISGSGLT